MTPASYDYVIIGSGIAGLYTALLAQEHGQSTGTGAHLAPSDTSSTLSPTLLACWRVRWQR